MSRSDFVKELRERLRLSAEINQSTAKEDFDFGVARGLQKAIEILDDSKSEWDFVKTRGTVNRFRVFWTDCESYENWTAFETRGEAEQFAQWCCELGDMKIRVEEMI